MLWIRGLQTNLGEFLASPLSYDMMPLKVLFLTPQRGQYLPTSNFQNHNPFPKMWQPLGKTGGAPRGQGESGREGLHPGGCASILRDVWKMPRPKVSDQGSWQLGPCPEVQHPFSPRDRDSFGSSL